MMNNFIKSLLFIFVLIFSFSCENEEKLSKNNEIKENLIDDYLKLGKDKTNSDNARKDYLDRAYAMCSSLPDGVTKREYLHKISIGYYSLEDFLNFKKLNKKVLQFSENIKDSFGSAISYAYLGIYYRRSKLDLDSAYVNCYKAEKIYASMDRNGYDHKEISYNRGKVLLDLARILQRTKNYSESEDLTIKAIEEFEKANKFEYLPLSYTNLGLTARRFEHYEEAVEYHLKAMDYAKGTAKEISHTVASYNNIGITLTDQQKYNEAKKNFAKALSYNEFLKQDRNSYARLLDNLAYVNFLSGDLEEIPNLFFEALRLRDSLANRPGIITSSLHISEYYKSIGLDSLSKLYALKAKDVSLEINNNEELLKSYQILSDVSNNQESLKYAQSYIKLSDSLYREERLFRDKFARIQFETDQIQERNVQISRENEILVVAVLGLTALFLLVYIIFRQQQSNKELLFAQQQQETNQEIYRLLLNQQVKLEEGRQMEQQRMSEELHDGVLGRLFGVRLSLDGINQRANDGFTEARNKYIEELKSIEKEIRLISHDLGTETLSPEVAYIDAVESLISDLCEAHKMEFEFRNDENIDWEQIDDQKKVNLFRILQESMQNIFKHARAKKIKISFDYVDDNINLLILDDGIGFKSTKVKRGIGLKNITSRVSQMSGVVDFISNKDAGTTVSVSVPV